MAVARLKGLYMGKRSQMADARCLRPRFFSLFFFVFRFAFFFPSSQLDPLFTFPTASFFFFYWLIHGPVWFIVVALHMLQMKDNVFIPRPFDAKK